MLPEIRDFDPTIPQPEVDRLWNKLRDARLPEQPIVPDAGDEYGPPLEWARKLHAYWRDNFDWAAAQRRISAFEHHTTEIAGLKIHFVHQRARGDAEATAIPLLLVHGWPGSWFEFSRVIDALSEGGEGKKVEKAEKADADADGEARGVEDPAQKTAFHVVVPSLPGFAWSSPPHTRDWTLQNTAQIFDTLMMRLGYRSYVAQGGDWGHFIVRELGAHYSQRCKAVHTNMCPAIPPTPKGPMNDREILTQKRMDWFLGKPRNEAHMGYAVLMRTRPQTIGIALSDSPVGIMMWVGDKYYELVDPRYRTLDDKQFLDDLCTTLCLYFFTSPSVMTSALVYTDNVRHEDYVEFVTKKEHHIRVPFGFSSFLYDLTPTSRRAAETTGNLQWYQEYDQGGHFPALEMPKDFIKDLRDCFYKLYVLEQKLH
ncbi:Alpha/Beta hydrolase protein [Xylariaceae sp. FL0804]|nr:Alpha/Beta hydrolase protein [Xylariaceae sp. FL0804]